MDESADGLVLGGEWFNLDAPGQFCLASSKWILYWIGPFTFTFFWDPICVLQGIFISQKHKKRKKHRKKPLEFLELFFYVENTTFTLHSDTDSLLRTIVKSRLHKLENFFAGYCSDDDFFFQCYQYLEFLHENWVIFSKYKRCEELNYHPS